MPAPESGQTDTPTEAAAPAAPSEAPAPAETGAETATDSDDTDTPDAEPPAEPASAVAAQPVTLPPLAALIQPLITPQNGPKGDPEDKAQGELTGSTPRQRGMAGRLTLLTDGQNPAQTQDGAASFANQMNPAQSQGPQDHLPPQGDAAQNAMAERDVALTDTATETSGAPTAPPQPLPADTRATATPGPTPQRLPDAAPLDTTQSGWEAALTERITARNTDLGQEIEITLNPENLGHIRIKLDLSDKAATVQIITDTPQAAHLFQQSETRLAEALNRAGLSLTSHDATSRDAGGRQDGQGGQRQGQTPGNPRAEAALAGLRGTLAAPSVSGRAANLVNIVA
jgi:flagellar hook-length control protein FliK